MFGLTPTTGYVTVVGTVVSRLVLEVQGFFTFGFEDINGKFYTVWVDEDTARSREMLPLGSKMALIVDERYFELDDEQEPQDVFPAKLLVI